MKKIGVVFGLVGLIAGCGSSVGGDTSDEMGLSQRGKQDLVGIVAQGPIAVDEAKESEFQGELETHTYTLQGGAGMDVTAEVTRRGSSSRVDTVLSVYGPRTSDGESGPLVAVDDNAGYGLLSKVTTELPENGTYTVALTTKDGLGRGKYRLSVVCNDACLQPVVPVSLAAMPLEEPISEINNIDDEYMWFQAGKWKVRTPTGGGRPRVEDIADAVAAAFEAWPDPDEDEVAVTRKGEVTRRALNDGFFDLFPFEVIDIQDFERAAELGSYRIAAIEYSWNCAPSVECSGIVFAAYDAETEMVYGFNIGAGDE